MAEQDGFRDITVESDPEKGAVIHLQGRMTLGLRIPLPGERCSLCLYLQRERKSEEANQ